LNKYDGLTLYGRYPYNQETNEHKILPLFKFLEMTLHHIKMNIKYGIPHRHDYSGEINESDQ